jgi:hypothetical protein
MKLTTFTIIMCGLLTLSSACKKDENDSPVGKMMQAGKWQISASEIIKYMDRDTSIDYYTYWRPCEQDDILEFHPDGKATSNENTDKCPEDNQENQFKWYLQNNDTRLMLSAGSGHVIQYDIVEVTDSRLRLQASDSAFSVAVTAIETYTNVR